MKRKITDTEYIILQILIDKGPLSIKELSDETGYNRTWIWKKLKNLENKGLVQLTRRGRILIAEYAGKKTVEKILVLGILRAAEYPYIISFYKSLQKRWNVYLKIYDDPYTLATDLSAGKVHLAMNPVVTLLLAHRISGGHVHIIGGGSGGGAGIIENPEGKQGHTTTMASSMEYCAVKEKLPAPRIYAKGGDEILQNVIEGKTRYGIVWEPYYTLAIKKGLKARRCDLPVCCLLGAHDSLREHYRLIRRLFAISVEWTKKHLTDSNLIETYSNLVELDKKLVKKAILTYKYYPEPPVELLKRNIQLIKETIIPHDLVSQAVII